MEQVSACILNARLESVSLRFCGASAYCLQSFRPRAAGAQTAWQCRKSAKFSSAARPSESPCLQYSGGAGVDSQSGITEGVRSRDASRKSSTRRLQPVASFQAGGGGGNDLPVSSCKEQMREHKSRLLSRVDARVGVDHATRNVDRQPATVAGISNAATLVEQARRSSMPLILTDDSLRQPGNLVGTELDSACQKSLVLPGATSEPSRQLCVAVDVDEVLGSFLATLNEFIAEKYLVHHDVSEYYIYDFMKIWNCSQAEANHRVHAFFESEHFKNGIRPIPGAYQTLLHLAAYCNLVVVTSRQHVIREPTLKWIERYYSGIFKEVHFGNHFALEGAAKPKSEICRSLGAHILIDDNPRYAMDCAECGIEVLLFDLHGGYPWSKTPCGPRHPLITRVRNWQEIERALLARTCVEL